MDQLFCILIGFNYGVENGSSVKIGKFYLGPDRSELHVFLGPKSKICYLQWDTLICTLTCTLVYMSAGVLRDQKSLNRI